MFAENEVWGIDILVTSSDEGKVRSVSVLHSVMSLDGLSHVDLQARMEESRTTIYQKESTVTYQLKMKTSRAVFSEVQKKAGAFPFNIRCLEDEKRARLGLQEAVQHSLVKPYEVM